MKHRSTNISSFIKYHIYVHTEKTFFLIYCVKNWVCFVIALKFNDILCMGRMFLLTVARWIKKITQLLH